MVLQVVHGVVGSDGGVPIYQPNGRWCYWGMHEIYLGTAGDNRYIPKVKDYVVDVDTYTTYIVDGLDPVTLIPTLREIRPANMSFGFTETDILFGVGPGASADTYRVYIDKSTVPSTMSVDGRLKVHGTASSYAKIYKGDPATPSGRVVSKIFDGSGVFVSENVPLELVALDSHINYATKCVATCNVTEDLVDGEIVTVVMYSDTGHVVSKRQLLVENTSFIRALGSPSKYITHISMRSIFLSLASDRLIEFPLNVPMNALNMIGIVHYSNGDTFETPVDGTKFTMFGLDQFVSSIAGQEIPLVLKYNMASDETAFAGVGVEGKSITAPYVMKLINPNNSYAVKLFCYPRWVSEAAGYSLEWWMLNLDRNVYFNVTPHVRFSSTMGVFDPKGYGYSQRKSVYINLGDVSGAFKNFIHTQILTINLLNTPQLGATPWTISAANNTTLPYYGRDIYANRVNDSQVNLKSEFLTKEEWLKEFYYATYPLVDNTRELIPIMPTHFVASIGNTSVRFSINDWDKNLSIVNSVDLYKNVSIRFVKQTSNGDLQLSIAEVIVRT